MRDSAGIAPASLALHRPGDMCPASRAYRILRCVPVRATRRSAANAAFLVASSPTAVASASANSAGSLRGARPCSLISTMRAIARAPSAAMQRMTAPAFSRVSALSPA